MWTQSDRSGNFWTRRSLLRVGSLGILGLSLPQLLRARESGRTQAASHAQDVSCIFIVQYGGASHIDTWDSKPDAPEEIRGPYKSIATSVPGLRMGELLPRLASLADRYCIIRSMSHGNSDHDGGMHVCLTGHSRPQEAAPCFGSVVSRLRPSAASLPAYVWLQNLDADVRAWYLTGGSLGSAHAPLLVGKGADNACPTSASPLSTRPPKFRSHGCCGAKHY
jgi:hypothetical protein